MTKKRFNWPKVGTLIEVIWRDVVADVSWRSEDDAMTHSVKIRSVGWVSKNRGPNGSDLTIYADRDWEDLENIETNRRLAIPTGWIEEWKAL